MEFSILVKGFVIKEDKLLIVRRSSKEEFNPEQWVLPGGHVEEGEKIEEAVVREIKEEVGINIDVIKINSVWKFKAKEKELEFIGVTFLCSAKENSIKLNEEIGSYEWIDLTKQLPDLPKSIIKEINCCRSLEY